MSTGLPYDDSIAFDYDPEAPGAPTLQRRSLLGPDEIGHAREQLAATPAVSCTVFIDADGYLECDVAPGDCVVFDGALTPHGRTPLGAGERVILVGFGSAHAIRLRVRSPTSHRPHSEYRVAGQGGDHPPPSGWAGTRTSASAAASGWGGPHRPPRTPPRSWVTRTARAPLNRA